MAFMFSLQMIKSALKNEIKDQKVLKGYKKNEGRIFGGQFQDGVSNAVDPMSIIRSVFSSFYSDQSTGLSSYSYTMVLPTNAVC